MLSTNCYMDQQTTQHVLGSCTANGVVMCNGIHLKPTSDRTRSTIAVTTQGWKGWRRQTDCIDKWKGLITFTYLAIGPTKCTHTNTHTHKKNYVSGHSRIIATMVTMATRCYKSPWDAPTSIYYYNNHMWKCSTNGYTQQRPPFWGRCTDVHVGLLLSPPHLEAQWIIGEHNPF